MSRRFLRLLALSVAVTPFSGTSIHANDGASNTATSLVAQALKAEADGELIQREQLLAQAASLGQDLPESNWYSGKLLSADGKWLSIAESVQAAEESQALKAYEKQRASMSDTTEGHWKMATWCAGRKLGYQCAAHLNAIIKADPDHLAARNALGYRLVENEWIGPERINELNQQAQALQESLTQFGPSLRQILTGSTSAVDISKRLSEIKNPGAIAAAESLASNLEDAVVKHVIHWLGQLDAPESSQSLCRFALVHPSTDVREAAANFLREKPVYDFMPELLSALSGPIQASLVPAFDRRGNLMGYQQAFTKEGMNENKIMLVNRTLSNRGRMQFRSRDPINVMLQNMAQSELAVDARQRVNSVAAENIDIQARNKRIVSLISEVTDQEFPSVPGDVWKWWDKYNETNYQSYKPARYRRDSVNFEVPQYSSAAISGRASGECFVAGTPISTQRGLKAVDQIAVGDMALSRNTTTGELCWKPVVACTTRPAEPTVLLSLDDGDLRCTGGHLLWVSGKGWTKASQIQQGDLLHTASEPAVVMKVRQANNAPTFNLEIAENHSYFAGTNRVLSHDVTARGSSRDLVPGQLRISSR